MEQFLSYDVAPFLACMNMIKINTQPIIHKMILTVLCDFKPSDSDNRNRTMRYIKILLEDQSDLADCLISFLPEDVLIGNASETQTSDIVNSSIVKDDYKWPRKEIKVRKTRKRNKVLAQAGQLLAQAASANKSKGASKSVTDPPSKVGKKNSGKVRSHGRLHSNPLDERTCVLIKSVHSSKLGNTPNAVLSQILRHRQPVLEGSPMYRMENPELAQKRPVQLITSKQPYYSTSTAMYGATTSPSFRFQEGHGLNLGPRMTSMPSMPLTYFPFMCNSAEKPITTAEDYLASHVNDQKLSGPDIMSPFLKSAPTCTISQIIREEKSPRKSPRKHLSLSSKIQALKQTCTEISSSHMQHKEGDDTKLVRDKVRIQQTSSTEIRGSPSPVFGSTSFNQNTKSYRNLSGFPYTHQLTFPDGQTQHLRIQGSGSSLVSPRNIKMNSATRLVGPDELQSSDVSPSQVKRKSSTATSSKGEKDNVIRE